MSHCTQFTLPDLISICPWTPATNPHHEEARAKSSAWIDSFDFFRGAKRQHFMRSATELFASYTYPYADRDTFCALSDAMNLFWTIDEMLDEQDPQEARNSADTFVKAMKGDLHDSSPIVQMTTDWKDQLSGKIGPNSWRRFVGHYTDFLAIMVHEREIEEQHASHTLKEYELHRRKNKFMAGCFCLSEFALNIDLPDIVFENEAFMQMHWAALDMLGYSNDLYSYGRERQLGLDAHNILTVAMHEKDMTLQQAADYVGELFQSLVDTFQKHKEQLPSFSVVAGDNNVDNDVATYVHTVEQAIIGNIFWSFETKRYFGEDRERVRRTLIVDL